MGLAQEVAYSSLLAFFPAVAFLLGFLGIVHLYDQVQILLGDGCAARRDPVHRRASEGLLGLRLRRRVHRRPDRGAVGGDRCDGDDRQGGQSRLRLHRDAPHAAGAAHLALPRHAHGADDVGDGRAHRLRRPARLRDRAEGSPRERVGHRLGDPPLAGHAGGARHVLRARLLPGAERPARRSGSGSRPAPSSARSSGSRSPACSRSTRASAARTRARTARSPRA